MHVHRIEVLAVEFLALGVGIGHAALHGLREQTPLGEVMLASLRELLRALNKWPGSMVAIHQCIIECIIGDSNNQEMTCGP
jgi:hypothetical protein